MRTFEVKSVSKQNNVFLYMCLADTEREAVVNTRLQLDELGWEHFEYVQTEIKEINNDGVSMYSVTFEDGNGTLDTIGVDDVTCKRDAVVKANAIINDSYGIDHSFVVINTVVNNSKLTYSPTANKLDVCGEEHD